MCHVVWGIDISFKKLTPEIGGWIWKAPFAHNASTAGISCKACLFFNISSGDLLYFSDEIPEYWSLRLSEKVQFKRCLLVCWLRCGKLVWIGSIKWIVWQRGLPGVTGNKRNLCTVPCHSYKIQGTWRSK